MNAGQIYIYYNGFVWKYNTNRQGGGSGYQTLWQECREEKMSILNEISENLQKGKAKLVKELVQQAIDQGIAARDILEQGLMSGMDVVGEKFKKNEVFVPEVLVAARDKVKIMVGGAPVTEDFCEQIGADKYTTDAASVADAAAEFCRAMA